MSYPPPGPGYGQQFPGYPGYGPGPAGYPVRVGRPATVTIAARLMFAAAAMILLYGIATLAMFMSVKSQAEERGYGPDNASLDLVYWAIGAACAIGALIVGLLGLGVLRGAQGARIATWVLNPLAVLYTLVATVITALMQLAFNSDPDRTADDIVPPDWFFVSSYLSGVVTVGLYVSVIVLLARRVSNDYFRNPN